MNPQTILKDPEFQGLPDAEKIKVFVSMDGDFASLPKQEQLKVFSSSIPEMKQGPPSWHYTVSDYARPILETAGMVVGGLTGATSGPGGAVAGGALGFAGGAETADRLDEYLGVIEPKPMAEQLIQTGKNLRTGATYEMGGRVLGSVVPPVVRGTKRLIRKASSATGISQEGAMEGAGKILKEKTGSNPIFDENLNKSRKLEKEVGGGLKFTRGQSTNDPQVISFERSRFRAPGEQGALNKEQVATGQGAVKEYADKTAGDGKVEDFVEGISNHEKRLNKSIENARTWINRLLRKIGSGQDQIKSGETIVSRVKEAKSEAWRIKEQLYDDIPDTTLEPNILADTIANMKKGFDPLIEKSKNFPNFEIRGILKKITKITENEEGEEIVELIPIGFKELRKIRSSLLTDIRQANSGLQPNAKKAFHLKELNKGVEATIDTLSKQGGEAGHLYKKASKFYKENYVEIFKQGQIASVLAKDATGAAKVRNAQVATRFFQPGKTGVEFADDFIKAVGDDEIARSAMKDSISHQFIDDVTDGAGNVVQSKLNTFLKKYTHSLDRFGLKGVFDDVAKAQELVNSSIETQSLFNRSAAAKALEASPDNVVSQIFSGKGMVNPAKTTKQLLSLVEGNKPAEEGIKTAVVNHIMKQAETNGVVFHGAVLSQAAMKKSIARFGPVLRELYKKEPHKIQAMLNVRKALETLERNQSSPLGGGSDTAENASNMIGALAPALTTRYALVNLIRHAARWVGVHGDNNIEAMLNRATFDPDIAYNMMSFASGRMTPDVVDRKVIDYMTTLGLYGLRQQIPDKNPGE